MNLKLFPGEFLYQILWKNINRRLFSPSIFPEYFSPRFPSPNPGMKIKKKNGNDLPKTFWKIESPNAISGIHLGGMAQKIFFLVTKLFCFSRQNAETFRFSLKLDFVKPHKISTHLAFSDNCYFHSFFISCLIELKFCEVSRNSISN